MMFPLRHLSLVRRHGHFKGCDLFGSLRKDQVPKLFQNPQETFRPTVQRPNGVRFEVKRYGSPSFSAWLPPSD